MRMKYIFLTIFFLMCIKSYGQFVKGDKVLGGTLSLNIQRAPQSPNGGLINIGTTFDLNPNFGFLISKNLEIGGRIGYSSSYYERNTTPVISEWRSKGVTAAIYMQRYYPISDKFLFSISGSINYSKGKDTYKTTITNTNGINETETNRNSTWVSLRPNFTFFPSANWGLQASLGNITYSHAKDKSTDETSNNFEINYGTISLGISYYFRK